MNVLIVLGHPRTESYCGALARAYERGAREAGMETRFLALGELDFDPHVRVDSPENQSLEADLARAHALLDWAEHLVFVYPTWWGTMPALLKGFLDRLVMPGEAFRFYGPGAMDWEALWQGKSAQLITTMDTPPPVYRLIYRSPGSQAMKAATLGFCGVGPVRTLICGPLRTSTAARRRQWLGRAHRAGAALATGVRSPVGRAVQRAATWLRALRLQFYPVTWAAYTVGALAAAGAANAGVYVLGYLFLFSLEAATVFCNDYFDFESDRRNRCYGPFTGGSRVLVDGSITFTGMRRGIGLAAAAAVAFAATVLQAAPQPATVLACFLPAAVLTLGYTVPPLRLSYRGVGELDVAVTHSALVLVVGYVLQGGMASDALPWLLSLPLGLAVLPAIVLAGIPDRRADARAGKGTIAARFGVRPSVAAAAVAVLASAVVAVGYDLTGAVGGLYDGIAVPVTLHAALCLWLLRRLSRRIGTDGEVPARIDGVLFATLNYMVWFVAVPLFWLF